MSPSTAGNHDVSNAEGKTSRGPSSSRRSSITVKQQQLTVGHFLKECLVSWLNFQFRSIDRFDWFVYDL